MTDYIKYLKYKKKYLDLKNEKQFGGSLNCNKYYGNSTIYSFENFNDMINFLKNFSGSNRNWENIGNTNSNYENTILHELIKINFDMTRSAELPELVKLILNIKIKPAHILEFACTKEISEYYKSILTNTYKGSKLSSGYIVTNIINSSIHKSVILAIQEILGILPENKKSNSTNTWDSLTKLLEFISCMLDSQALQYFVNEDIEFFKETLREQVIQVVFLEDIIYSKNKRKFKNLYTGIKNSNIDNIPYSDFLLKDFMSSIKNEMCILPPSVLLLLSIKLNPSINNPTNYYNIQLKNLLQYTRNECKNEITGETINNIAEIEIEKYLNEPTITELTFSDSVLIDDAFVSILNSSDIISSSNNKLESSNKSSLFYKIGKKSSELLNNITQNINNSIDKTKNTIALFVNTINIFKNKDPARIIKLNLKITELSNLLDGLYKQLEITPKTNRILFGFIKSKDEKIQDKIKEIKSDILNTLKEIEQIQTNIDVSKEIKLNIILSKILLMFGIGLRTINKDVCTVNNNNRSNITWNTFNKTLQILDGNIFKIINFVSSNTLTHLLIQNLVAYTTYLPFDIKTYFYEKLNFKNNEDIEKFKRLYENYSIELFKNFLHEDGYYYITIENDIEIQLTTALFPPSNILNKIKASIEVV